MTHEENEARPRTRLDETMRASLGATAVLMLATVVFSMVMTGAYLNYLQAWLGPYLLAASIACGVLALWTLLETAEQAGRRGAADGHGHGVPKVGALLLVPALLFAMAVPSSLGADALREAQPQQRVAADEALVFPPLDEEEVNELSLQDYSDRYVFGHPEELVGKPVRLLGFVGRLSTLPEEQWTVNRFRIFCCVADSTLFAAVVTGAPMPEGRDVWVEVEGVIDLAASDRLPVIVATDVEVVAKPEEPYL
ncbi:TIGR03943 family putative permease subunit [Arachnia propionica]|uniref:TIGR03943 family protein n=1 Tax=Arachnia propionica TaxID=1750 RepID=A0A3P1WRK3_9ACTN|nr:TIGR03943 family protein [Arachnia propionica]RRD49252.1 TIGR03943 family protein [Arachnia propionica]